MKSIRVLACVLVCLLLASGMALAQGTGASGEISGTVLDPSGAVLPNATVTATDASRGIKRSITSNANGHYEITGLLPAVYEVSVEHSGFQTSIQKGVVVSVGQTSTLDLHMKVAGGTESVEVTTEAPAVDTERGHQANTINQQLITDLPINRRDYLTFTLLAPGVSDSTRMANDQDFRVKQTPQSGLSFYGGNGRGNSVTVDGGEANDDSGGVRLTLGQDAVQEFQINRSNYGADLGGASGANINIVSKSGTNDLHGSLFGFFRNDAMDAANPFAFTQALQPGQAFNPLAPDVQGTPTKDTLTREQFGGSFGFPISKDKTFGFVAVEGLIQNAQNAVPLLTNTNVLRPDNGQFSGNNQTGIINGLTGLGATPVPCLTGQPALPAATCAGILTSLLTVSPVTAPPGTFQVASDQYLIGQLESNGGLFKYDTREYFISGRLDHVFNDSNQAYLRYSFAHDNEQNPDVQSLIGFSAGSSVHAYDNTAQAAWFHQFSPKTQNELRGQFNYTGFNVLPNVPAQVGLSIPGFANLGTNIFLPSLTIMRRPDIADNITMIRGHHTMKFGGEFLYRGNHTESHTFFPGRFVFGNLPGGIVSPCLQVPAACGLPANTLPAAINGLQSASLGLPQFYQQGFGNPIYNYPRPFGSAYWQDTWAMTPNFNLTFGLRYEVDGQYGALTTDKDNFAPRAAFVWDPFGDHKVAIRGGVGIFYSPIYGQIADVVQTLGFVNGIRPIAQVFVPLTGAPGNPALNSAVIYQTFFASGPNGGLIGCTTAAPGSAACITPANLAPFGINVTNTGPPPPLSVVFSGQPDYQSPYSEQASFGIEGEVAKGWSVSLSGIYVHTLRLPVALDVNDLPAPFTTATSPFTGQQVTFQNWAAPQCGANPASCFVNPLILQADQYSSKGSSVYEGAILEVQKRFSSHMSLLANYTFSKAIDTTTDFNSDFGPQNNLNLAGERGLSTFDQRHKVVIATVLETPWKNQFLGGWQLSPIFRYNSPHPVNILAAGTDINGDRHSTNDRPLGIGRNTGIGPNYYDFDMGLTKAFKVGERAQVQFIAQGFNIFNRTNFGSVNNSVPTLNGFTNIAPNASGFSVNPALVNPGGAPLAFTSALPKRQLQLGARLVF